MGRCLACTAVMEVMGVVMAMGVMGVMGLVTVAARGQPIPTPLLPTAMVVQLCLVSRIPIPACINLLQYKWEILPHISPLCSILLLAKLCITSLLCKSSKKRLPCMCQVLSYM